MAYPRSAMQDWLFTATATGAGAWLPLRSASREFAMQIKRSTATSNFTVTLQGTLTTASTSPYTEISYTQADVNTVKRSTAGRLVTKIRYNVTTLSTAAGKSLTIAFTAMPGV